MCTLFLKLVILSNISIHKKKKGSICRWLSPGFCPLLKKSDLQITLLSFHQPPVSGVQ